MNLTIYKYKHYKSDPNLPDETDVYETEFYLMPINELELKYILMECERNLSRDVTVMGSLGIFVEKQNPEQFEKAIGILIEGLMVDGIHYRRKKTLGKPKK